MPYPSLSLLNKRKSPLTQGLINRYKIELTYSSNALEGNSLTRMETQLVLQKGITSGGKTLKEHLEAINHAFAFDYILSLAQNQKHTITIQDLYTIDNLLIRDLDMPQSGPLAHHTHTNNRCTR